MTPKILAQMAEDLQTEGVNVRPYVDLAEIFGRNNHPIRVGIALSEQDEPFYVATLMDADQAGYRTQCACGEILNVNLCPRCGRKFE